MFVLIICPECGKSMKVAEEAQGSDATCPSCGHVFPTVAEPIEEPTGAEEVSEAEVLEDEDVALGAPVRAEAAEMAHGQEAMEMEPRPHAAAHADQADEFHAGADPVEQPMDAEEAAGKQEWHEAEAAAKHEWQEAEAAPIEQLLHPEDANDADDAAEEVAEDVVDAEEVEEAEEAVDAVPDEGVAVVPAPARTLLGKRSETRKRNLGVLIGSVVGVILVAGGAVYFLRDGSTPTDPAKRPSPTEGATVQGKPGAADAPPDSLDALKTLGLSVTEKNGKVVAAVTSDKFTDDTLPYLVKHLADLEDLTLRSPRVSNAGVGQLAGLKNLRRLDFGGDLGGKELLTGAGLAELQGLTKLEEIDLSKTGVSDDALVHLQGWPRLRTLSLAQTPISDAGLARLQGLRTLSKVNLAGTKITDAGLASLKKLTRLEELTLPQTAINGSGLANLKFCNRLATLDLSGTQVSDPALAHLQSLKKLETLRLDRTPITAAGLTQLKGLTNLRSVQVRNTQITKESSAKVKKVLPKVQIDF